MASFDENGKYIKTNWKAGDKITATKLNKIEESIETVNDNDISRHVEADARLDALEAKDVTHDKEFTNIKKTIADNKAAAELGDYEINSRMTFLENEFNEGIEEVHNVASTVDGKIAAAENNVQTQLNQTKTDIENQLNQTKTDIENQLNQTKTDIENQLNQTRTDIETTVNDTIDDAITPVLSDLSSSISEELTNNDVISFKAGTSNVTGVDLSNQMKQSIVSLDNIEGRSVREDVDDDYMKIIKCITVGDLELKSLPNGTKDTYSNGVYTKKINRVYFKDLNWSHYSDGTTGTKTTIYKADIPDMATCGEASSTNYNFTCSRYDMVSANAQWATDEECMSMTPLNKGVYIRLSKTSITSTSSIRQYLGFHYIDYELETPIEETRELNFLCNSGDIIDTKSPIPFTCSHTVQLNTKAQVEEAQKQIIKSNKSIWQKVKDFTDVKISIGENGYIKFPTAFGGVSIQWGFITATGDGTTASVDQTFILSIPISTMCYCGTGDAQREGGSWRNLLVNISRHGTNTYRVTWNDMSGTKITNCSARWLIIGR